MRILKGWTWIAGAGVALVLGAAPASAAPVVFDDTGYTATVFAQAGADVQSDGAAFPGNALPLGPSVTAADADASASASAAAGPTGLSASAQSAGALGLGADALASGAFDGRFTAPGGLLQLLLDVTIGTSALGDGVADGYVRVTLLGDGATLIDEIVRQTMRYAAQIALDPGATAVLSLEAVASASSAALFDDGSVPGGIGVVPNPSDGSAAVTFALNRVPEPGTWALVAACALVMIMSSPACGGARRAAAAIRDV